MYAYTMTMSIYDILLIFVLFYGINHILSFILCLYIIFSDAEYDNWIGGDGSKSPYQNNKLPSEQSAKPHVLLQLGKLPYL